MAAILQRTLNFNRQIKLKLYQIVFGYTEDDAADH